MSIDELSLHKRLDIFVKLIYAKEKLAGNVSDWAMSCYLDHIEVFNGFLEPGSRIKNSRERFIDSFDQLLSSMKQVGFDSNLGKIPVDTNGIPQNGAHRLASAIALGIDIEIETSNDSGFSYDFNYFRKNGLSETILDRAATEFIDYCADSVVFIAYPASKNYFDKIEDIFNNDEKLVYSKSIDLNPLGSVNAIWSIYQGEKWLGNESNDFYGTRSKANECFGANGGVARVYVINTTPERSLALKQRIREVVKQGKHAIHCTDTQFEAQRLARIFLNHNSLDYINFATLTAISTYQNKLDSFQQWLLENDVDIDSLCIDGGSILASYGLRDTQDLDFIHLDELDHLPKNHKFESHNHEAYLFGVPIREIILNPHHHYYVGGIRHVTVKLLHSFKSTRDEPKDREDVKLIETILKGTPPKYKLKFKFRLRIWARKIKFELRKLKHRFFK